MIELNNLYNNYIYKIAKILFPLIIMIMLAGYYTIFKLTKRIPNLIMIDKN